MNGTKFKVLFNHTCNLSSSPFYSQLSRRPYIRTYPEKLRRILRDDYDVIVPNSDSEVVELASQADVIVGFGRAFSPRIIEAARKVRLLQVYGAGIEGLPLASLKEKGVLVANTGGSYNSISVAEHAFALILALAKRVVSRHNCLCRGIWETTPSDELHGKVLGIIGFGNIGKEIAKRGAAFGMRTLATKRSPQGRLATEFGLEFLGGPRDLDYLLVHSDFLVIAVPITSETLGMIGERELKMMKPTSYLINVSRGSIVREEALYVALKEKWISGAGIDTWYRYPPRRDGSVTPRIALAR